MTAKVARSETALDFGAKSPYFGSETAFPAEGSIVNRGAPVEVDPRLAPATATVDCAVDCVVVCLECLECLEAKRAAGGVSNDTGSIA